MNVHRIGTLIGSALVLSIGVIGMPGCSSTTTGTDGGSDSGGNTEGGGGDGGGDSGSSCPKDSKCAAYCDFFSSTCTGMDNGGVDNATCKALCNKFTANDTTNLGTAADTSGGTIGCRIYHTCAASQMMKSVHCGHGNIWSVMNTCETMPDTQCATYCKINLATCTGANAAFGGMNECLSKCGLWNAGKPGDSSGNSLACRQYHLGVASTSDMNAMMHCSHTGDMSSQCM